MRRLAMVMMVVLAAACTLKEEAGPPGTIPAPPDVAAPPPDALRTPSGLASKMLRVGLGSVHPRPNSIIAVHYTGWTTKGEMFDSSVARGRPEDGGTLNQFIPGWVEGIQLMVAGEKRRFWIPGSLAYGDDEQHAIGGPGRPRGMLVFDVELLAVR